LRRSTGFRADITASSFWPVKYVLKNSSCDIPKARSSFSVTVFSALATRTPS